MTLEGTRKGSVVTIHTQGTSALFPNEKNSLIGRVKDDCKPLFNVIQLVGVNDGVWCLMIVSPDGSINFRGRYGEATIANIDTTITYCA